MNSAMGIGTSIPEIQDADIAELAKTAEHEANPLYPVPVLWTTKELVQIYEEVKNGWRTNFNNLSRPTKKHG